MLPTNFNTAIRAAAYLTALTAYPDKEISFTHDAKTLQIGPSEIELPSVDSIHFPKSNWYSFRIGKDLSLRINKNGSFEAGGSNDDSLQKRLNTALNKTGFTPTRKFGLGHKRNLQRYGFLFNNPAFDRHLDSLVQRFPSEIEEHLQLARGTSITRVSQTYLDAKLADESCLQIPISGTRIPYSNLKRAGKLIRGTAVLIGTTLLSYRIFPEVQQTLQQAWQFYQDLLFNHGFAGTAATNSASTSFFYGLGDILAQYIEGNITRKELDKKRFLRTAAVGAEYGVELTGLYWGLNKYISLPNKWLNSGVKAVTDICGYGMAWFNNRHIYMMEKEGRLNPLDFLRQDKAWSGFFKKPSTRQKYKMLGAYGILVWIPYQTWNRVYHADQQQVGYVCLAVPPFTVFLSLVSNEKKDLVEFKQVMGYLKQT